MSLKRNVSLSVELTLDLDCNDVNNYSGCDTDNVNSYKDNYRREGIRVANA